MPKPLDPATSAPILPNGSSFGPLPPDHWLYAAYSAPGATIDGGEVPTPVLNPSGWQKALAAARWAIRVTTRNGTEPDFDPDALAQNIVYALCGPKRAVASAQTVTITEPNLGATITVPAEIAARVIRACRYARGRAQHYPKGRV